MKGKPAGGAGNKWSCKHGCDLSKGECPHLTRLIGPKVGVDTRKLVYRQDLDKLRWASPVRTDGIEDEEVADLIRAEAGHTPAYYEGDAESEADALAAKLRAYGLAERKIAVVIDRLHHGKTWREIAADQGYAGASGAERAFQDAKKQLKRRGYSG